MKKKILRGSKVAAMLLAASVVVTGYGNVAEAATTGSVRGTTILPWIDEIVSEDVIPELSDDIYSFQISLDGSVIQLPVRCSVLESIGFEYDEDPTEKIYATAISEDYSWYKGDFIIDTGVYNYDINAVPYTEGVVTSLSVTEQDDCNNQVLLPRGIELGGSGYDDIVAAYGIPSYCRENDYNYSLSYSMNHEQYISFYVEKDTDTLSEINIYNEVSPYDILGLMEVTDFLDKVDTEAPAIEYNYTAPEALSAKPDSGIFEFAGHIYAIGCPVAELLENGFVINEYNSDPLVPSHYSVEMELRYGNQIVEAEIANVSDSITCTENCKIRSITFYGMDSEYAVVPTIGGNVKVGDSEEVLLEALEGCDYDDDWDTYTIYNEDSICLSRVSIEDGIIDSVTISALTEWEYYD